MSDVKPQQSTLLNPMQQFYGTPTPENAVLLAIADHRAHCDPMQPQSEFITALQKAHERLLAYPKLTEALSALVSQYYAEQRDHCDANFIQARALLRELGESS